jgi:hypothetical protein
MRQPYSLTYHCPLTYATAVLTHLPLPSEIRDSRTLTYHCPLRYATAVITHLPLPSEICDSSPAHRRFLSLHLRPGTCPVRIFTNPATCLHLEDCTGCSSNVIRGFLHMPSHKGELHCQSLPSSAHRTARYLFAWYLVYMLQVQGKTNLLQGLVYNLISSCHD